MADTGLYPADQWRPGLNYKAFDWGGYDEDDFPAEVSQQIAAERKAQQQQSPASGSGTTGESFKDAMSRRTRRKTKS